MKYKFRPDGFINLFEVPIEQPGIGIVFSTVVLKALTPLEFLDVEIDAGMSRVEMAVRSSAHLIATWDDKEINVLELMDRKYHRAIAMINEFVDRHCMILPEIIQDYSDLLLDGGSLTFEDGFAIVLKPITMLEMLDLQEQYSKGLRSERRCKIFAEIITDWNGSRPSAEELYANPENHKYLVSLDRWLDQFFRFPDATEAEEVDSNDDLPNASGEPRELSSMVEIVSH